MRVLRVRHRDQVFYASLAGREVTCLNKDLGLTAPIPLKDLAVLPPVVPTKIICIGLNYRRHAEEMGREVPAEPLLFLKPPSSVIGSGQAIMLPPQSHRIDHEGELAMVIGKSCKGLAPKDVPDHIFGYACANDVTARDLQNKDGLFARAKGFDTFCPIGPWIETQLADPSDVAITTTVNGEVRQQARTSDMVHSPYELVSFISNVMTLYPGDVVLTGTPAGIGPLQAGDEVRVEIETIGILINPVIGGLEAAESAPEGPLQ